MKRSRPVILSLFIFVVLLSSCIRGGGRVSRMLDKADTLMFRAPDSAVALLDSLELGSASRAERARHALLLTKALRKNHVTITDDSLITVATNYYRGRGDSLETQSLFYRGVILANSGDHSNALLSLMQAADLARATGDDFYLAMSCREQAAVYTALYSFDKAYDCRLRAIESFNRCSRPLHAVWERVYLPQDLVFSDRKAEAYDSVCALAADSLIQSDRYLREEFHFIASNVCYENHKLEEAESYFEALISEGGTPSSRLYSQMAELYAIKKDVSGARLCYVRAVATRETEADSIAADYALSAISKAEGDLDRSYALYHSAHNRSNRLSNSLMTHRATTQIVDHYHSEAVSRSRMLGNAARRIVLLAVITLVLILIITISVFIHRRRLRQKEAQLEAVINELSALRDTNKALSGKTAATNILNSILEARNSMLSGDEGSRRFGKDVLAIINSLSSDENIAEIEDYVNKTNDGIMAKFRRHYPDLKETYVKVAALIFFELSPESISAIMQYNNMSSFRSAKLRIQKHIEAHPNDDSDFFLSFFKPSQRI